jgi:hypothetical protein
MSEDLVIQTKGNLSSADVGHVKLTRLLKCMLHAGQKFSLTPSSPSTVATCDGAEDCIDHAIRTYAVNWSRAIFILLQLYCFVLYIVFNSNWVLLLFSYSLMPAMNPWSISFHLYVYVYSSWMVERPDLPPMLEFLVFKLSWRRIHISKSYYVGLPQAEGDITSLFGDQQVEGDITSLLQYNIATSSSPDRLITIATCACLVLN